jgi:hypothetical protein
MRAIPLVALSVLAIGAAVSPARAQNVSINATISGEIVPGVYGQVVLGNQSPPPVVYAQPVVVEPAPVIVGAPAIEPIYLHVPPGHARNWRKHCHEYNACNRPVYFVRSAEYDPGYRPDHDHHEHGRHDDDHDRGDHGHGHHDHD